MEQINADNFDAKRTFENLLRTQNLKNLVQINLEIQAEIKSLDHDVQSLVFENYSKFISSIDVVKKMREEIEKTEKDLDRLADSIEKIKEISTNIDETLKPKRNEIQKLDKINKDLSNLKMLCELPILLKEDLKQLHSMDLLNLNSEELARLKPDLLKLLKTSLENLNICKDKLIEFHSEPLISPIFNDVSKYLREIQNYLFLHFYDNNTKLGLDLLGDVFIKLFNILWILELMAAGSSAPNPSNALENLMLTFFKYAQSAIYRKTSEVLTKVQPALVDNAYSKEYGVEGSKDYAKFKASVIENFAKKVNSDALDKLKQLVAFVFVNLSIVDKQLLKFSVNLEVVNSYNTKKVDLVKKFLFHLFGSVPALDFYSKLQMVLENKNALNFPEETISPLTTLAEEFVAKDMLKTFENFQIAEYAKLNNKEVFDVSKSTSNINSRDEGSAKFDITTQADSFTLTILHYSQLCCDLLTDLIGDQIDSPLVNSENILYALVDQIISFENYSANYSQLSTAGSRNIADISFVKDGPAPKPVHRPSAHQQLASSEDIARQMSTKKKVAQQIHYIFISRLLLNLSDSLSKQKAQELQRKFICCIMAYQESWLMRVFRKVSEPTEDPKVVAEAMKYIKGLAVFVNSITISGIPKTRLAKGKITEVMTKSSETSKLLARQAAFFEEENVFSRQRIFYALVKLFFKAFKLFFIESMYRTKNLSSLFMIFGQGSQILFECCERDEESGFTALFYQAIDDFEATGFTVDHEKLDKHIQQVKESVNNI